MTTTQRTAAQRAAAQASHDNSLAMGATCTTQKLVAGGSLRKDDRTPDKQTPNTTASSLASAGTVGAVRSPATSNNGKTLEQGQNVTPSPAAIALPDNELRLAQGIHDASVSLGAECQPQPASAKAISEAELQKLVEDPLAAMKAVHGGGGRQLTRKGFNG